MKKSILKTALFSIIGFLLLYSLLGFLILPKVLSNQLPTLAKEHLNRDLQFDDLQFNPFSLELDIKGFKVKKIGVNSFFNFQRLYINVAVLKSIVDLTLTIDEIQLKQPNLFVIRDKQGQLNFSDVLARFESEDEQEQEEDPSTDAFPVSILHMAIADGKLGWRDDYYSNAQKEDIHPINLSIDNFTTVPQEKSHLDIVLSTASGGRLEWQGEIELFPFNSSGHIKLEKVDFHKVWELFLQDDVNFNLLNGSEVFEADYELTDTADGMQLLVKNSYLDINNFQLTEKGANEPLINIPNFKISGISVNLLKQEVMIDEVSAKDARFKAWLNGDSTVNYQSLFATKTSNKPVAQQSPPEGEAENQPWNIVVKKLAMNNFALQFSDKSLQKPANLNLTSIYLNSSDLTTNPGSQLPFEFGFTINESGRLKLQGQTIVEPFSTNVKVEANDIAIKDFQPYIDKFARLDIISGLFNANLNFSIIQEHEKPLGLSFKGDSHITDFVSRNRASNKDFLKWKKLSLNSMNMDLATNSYTIDKVMLDQPYSRILIRKDRSINVNDIAIQASSKQQTSAEQEASTKQGESTEQGKSTKPDKVINKKQSEPSFSITQFEIINGVSDFADYSMILPFASHITKIKGSVKGISLDKNAVIKVALVGRAHGLAPVNIQAKISPDNGNSDVKFDFKNLSLPLMTPYMAEFAGRKIEKGNMSLGLKYKIHNRQLTASNNLLIDQLTLGESVNNPKAVSLPLDLAIALLEDTDGKIVLDVPITGSLDDPQFSVATIVIDALVNVITKVVAAPFNAIASLIDSDEDISTILFSSGKAELNAEQQKKLGGLASALTQKTGLILEITGAAYTEHDWPSLQAEALDKQLLQIHLDKINKNSDKKVLLEDISVSDSLYKELLADLFIEKFPKLGDRTLFGTPRLIEPQQGDFYEVAKEKLSVIIPPNLQRLRELATERAKIIASYLDEKEIPLDRVYLLKVDIDPEQSQDTIAATLSLTVN